MAALSPDDIVAGTILIVLAFGTAFCVLGVLGMLAEVLSGD